MSEIESKETTVKAEHGILNTGTLTIEKKRTYLNLLFHLLSFFVFYSLAFLTAAAQCPSGVPAGSSTKLPIKMVVIGDSIVWGEGLTERNKFSCQVRQWIEKRTGSRVDVSNFSHAGAVIEPRNEKCSPIADPGCPTYIPDEDVLRETLKNIEEVNISYPTINQQLDKALKEFEGRTEEVRLVLVDGCANDVNFRNVLNVRNTPDEVARLTRCHCGKPMEDLLKRIVYGFGKAKVIVTGYFPMIFAGDQENRVKGTANNLLTRYVIGTWQDEQRPERKECVGRSNVMKCLDELSRRWFETSNESIEQSVARTNQMFPEQRAFFAGLHFPPDYAFSTKQSMLWNFKYGATNLAGLKKFILTLLQLTSNTEPNDDVLDSRTRQCKKTYAQLNDVFKSRRKQMEPCAVELTRKALNEFKRSCKYGSLGHPNRYGAALYAQAIVGKLELIWPTTQIATQDK